MNTFVKSSPDTVSKSFINCIHGSWKTIQNKYVELFNARRLLERTLNVQRSEAR